MKKLAVIVLAAFAFVSCDDNKYEPIELSQMPNKAQDLVGGCFADKTVISVFVDDDLFDKEYEVRFDDGTDVDFNGDGEWTSVETRNGIAVPDCVIPEGVKAYIVANHPNNYVVDIDKDRREYDVQLDNEIELVFDRDGNFKYYED